MAALGYATKGPGMRKLVPLLAVLASAAGLAAFLLLRTPAVPNEWLSISSGMNRDEVLAVVPDHVRDMRGLKGFDLVTRKYRPLGLRPCWWCPI